MKLLAIDASILGEHSVSRHLMQLYLTGWQKENFESTVIYRDLVNEPISHLSQETLSAQQKPNTALSLLEKKELLQSETLLDEFLTADEVIISAPMYNFSIASQLKAWIDRIVIAGKTFKYTEQGVVGLATGKKVTIISTRGGQYTNNASMQSLDHQESYLQTVFGFIGIPNLTIVRAEGLHRGEAIKEKAINLAEQSITRLFLKAA